MEANNKCKQPQIKKGNLQQANDTIMILLTIYSITQFLNLYKLNLLHDDDDKTLILIFFAGGTVSEEEQKDAGHFDPLHHSHRSNYYSFWNKVLIMHSSGFCFLCGCLWCICVDLDLLVSVLLKTKLTAFHSHQKRQEEFLVPLQVHFGLCGDICG